MTKNFESSSTPERNANLNVGHETPPVNYDLSAFWTEIEASSSSRFTPVYANTSEQAGVNHEASTPFARRVIVQEVDPVNTPPLADLPFREDLNMIRARNHRWDDMSYSRVCFARDRLDIWNSEYWAAEMTGATPRIPAFTIPSIPIRSTKSRRHSNRSDAEIINSGSCLIGAYEAAVAEKEEQIKSLLACTDVDATRRELDRKKARADSWEVSANANRQSADNYAAQVEVLKGEKHRLEDEVKKRDVHLEAASAEIAGLRANLEKSRLTEDRLRRECDEARRRADEIANGSFAHGARHSSRLERIRSYLIALHAQEEVKDQLCYRHGARMSLEKMVEAEYELPPGLLENYIKEEEEYLTKVESFDPLGDDTLFPTPPPPPDGLPRDVASQVPDGISEHGSFLSPQDNQDGDQI
ncbi:hypothetical protein AALP_AA2G096900 [Arabis alpina]|uniref:Uncharacterized protein n=1 Tax=Arabis alpina TaxID=50452 RepID=A0A087HGD4_ARAAL|nr:hypothetical protein AALP_AA2G096900 [Arabis alpina]